MRFGISFAFFKIGYGMENLDGQYRERHSAADFGGQSPPYQGIKFSP
jgi:hypothetical protein